MNSPVTPPNSRSATQHESSASPPSSAGSPTPLGDFQWVRETPDQTRYRNPLRLLFGSLFLLFLAFAILLRSRSDEGETFRSSFNASPLPGQIQEGRGERRSHVWREASESERAAARASISAQLQAFKRDDFEAARRWQSSSLQKNFGSTKEFRSMIVSQYPQFAKAKRTRFGPSQATEDGQKFRIIVFLTGTDNVQIVAFYSLIKEKGAFRVDSVEARPLDGRRRDGSSQRAPSPVPDEASAPNVLPESI